MWISSSTDDSRQLSLALIHRVLTSQRPKAETICSPSQAYARAPRLRVECDAPRDRKFQYYHLLLIFSSLFTLFLVDSKSEGYRGRMRIEIRESNGSSTCCASQSHRSRNSQFVFALLLSPTSVDKKFLQNLREVRITVICLPSISNDVNNISLARINNSVSMFITQISPQSRRRCVGAYLDEKP